MFIAYASTLKRAAIPAIAVRLRALTRDNKNILIAIDRGLNAG